MQTTNERREEWEQREFDARHYLTCEHCDKRIARGSHFVCQGNLVQGTWTR